MSDALCYADQTIGPHGKRMTIEYRSTKRSPGMGRTRRGLAERPRPR